MGWSPLVVLVITALLSMRTLQQMQVQQMQVQPTDQSVLEQTAVQNLSEASTGRYDATVCDDLAELSAAACTSPFEQQMASLEEDARCVLDRVIGAYNQLTVCLERLSHSRGCYYPNGAVHTAFLRVHSAFFGRCRPRAPERQPEDAPRLLVLCLTLAPVALVPLLVYAAARCRPMTAGSQ
ncbi:receptor activity-modifying protein 1-like isoform X2 [Syngnathus acus]|uniref:receptor activity-modifying protein 1-like isoform X2 n=1 Tax=Syngnathus acus TaxID=161584 RepID=UPI00188605CF|nr:receptor activity-modifying protein 1-like isoform X2 [Syngnathus acus]